MELSKTQVKFLKNLAHHLKPVILTGANGVSEAVINETQIALAKHELIKIKVRGEDKAERESMLQAILKATGAAKVNYIGHTLTIYRPADEPSIQLPK